MGFMRNFPFYGVVLLLSIFYVALFANYRPILESLLGNNPVGLIGLLQVCVIFFLPLGAKTGIVLRERAPSRVKFLAIYSLVIIFITTLIVAYWKNAWWQSAISGAFFFNNHRTIVGVFSASLVLCFYILIVDFINPENFLEAFQKVSWASPVFCFAPPAFWTTALQQLKFTAPDISVLSGVSVFSGLIFLTAALLFIVAKNMKQSVLGGVTDEVRKMRLVQAALVATFIALAILLFVCLEISYLVGRGA